MKKTTTATTIIRIKTASSFLSIGVPAGFDDCDCPGGIPGPGTGAGGWTGSWAGGCGPGITGGGV